MHGNASRGKVVLMVVLVLLFLGSIGANAYLFSQYRTLANDPQRQAKQEMTDLVTAVGKIMVLPEGEDPTIATVADTEKLKDQAFFANAQVGDKVLLYTTAKKAILFRPSTSKIIEVAPINLGNTQSASTNTPAVPVVPETPAPAAPTTPTP